VDEQTKIRCPCCGGPAAIQVCFSGVHSTYTLLDETMYYLVCIDCKYDSREYNTFYSQIELANYYKEK